MKSQWIRHGMRILCLLGLATLGGASLKTHAEPPQDNIAQKLQGAWRLVAVEGTNVNFRYAYDHPTGLIIYDRSGWMSVQIAVKGERKPFAKGVAGGTIEEKAAAFDGYLSYYGPYTLDLKAHTITHHIEDHSYPGGRGLLNVRWFQFEGDNRLLLVPLEDGKGGFLNPKDATYKLIWERAK